MTHLELLQQILDNQDPESLQCKEWDKIEYLVKENTDFGTILRIPNDKVSFFFTPQGQLSGIVNFKD